jgi:anti-sigma B factor antagonist
MAESPRGATGLADQEHRHEAASIDERGLRPPAAYAIRDGASASVVVLEGELDLASAPELRRRVDEASGPALVIDCSGTTFIDSAVLKELLRARAELAERDVRLILVGVPGPVRRLMDLTRTSELFEDAPDVDSALRRLSG